ncbi:carboxyltransferase subunit alpha [Periweissella beninensis]|uniref:acetyl-CoA carboxytransferase n=1 Tax=Periweissella beninensis TaxID=504936 RepID=A0ABT0VJ89_9LACO|nr:carboxyltransferase subunit alpha [Periweissella beninensis]MBM7544356.1 acetyl-CoA carboxylase carboxyl transferase subunit alpha [Periweissella beninensis]MCM2437731.1 carboxyltransferase [Periweissella beninensis]MCT4395939.1 carboxyltransferase [Periweissella beninensis]
MDLKAKIKIVRANNRIDSQTVIKTLFTDFLEIHGDRILGDDPSLTAGVALFGNTPVTVLAVNRGHTIKERIQMNFGAVRVTGYRKALRALNQAEKFKRPVITFINMPGADVSLASEDHGQSLALANMIGKMGQLTVPNIAVIIGEGYSGGALALANSNKIVMFEHALFSVASPEVVGAILKKVNDSVSLNEVLPMTAQKLSALGLVDEVIAENNDLLINLESSLTRLLAELNSLSAVELQAKREAKYQNFLATWE